MPGGVCVPLFAGDVAFYRAVRGILAATFPTRVAPLCTMASHGPGDRAWQANVPMAVH
ncbi:MAG: hypothetical protein QM758_14450 [Armatimonas sp.]